MEAILRTTKAVADANRLRILRILAGGAYNVAELTHILGVGQSTVSRHLKLLTEAGLVEVRRTGTWAYYSAGTGTGSGPGETFPPRLLGLLSEAFEGDHPDSARIELVHAERRRATARFFRRTAGEWDRVRDEVLGPSKHADRLVEMIGTGGTVVDLGTGTGFLLSRIARVADRVIGVDASPEMLEAARRRADADDLSNTDLRLGTFEHLPLSDGEADAMVANLVLHHVADVPSVLRDIRRGLAPGGRLLIADLEEHDEQDFWANLGARWPGFRPSELGERLAGAGFADVRWSHAPVGDEPGRAADEGNGHAGASPGGKRPRVFLMEAARP